MTTQPALVSKKLFEEINTLFANRAINEFNVQRIKNEAKKLMPVAAADAYMLLGTLDCLEWNIQGMRENHARALRLAPADMDAHLNFITSLDRMNYVSEAYERLQDLYKMWPNDPEVVDRCIKTALRAGRISAARRFLNKWERLCPDNLNAHASFIVDAEKILSFHCVDDEQGARMQEAVNSVLQNEHVFILWGTHHAIFEDNGVINYEFVLDLSYEAVIDLNMKVAERVVEKFGSEWPSSIVYSFVPLMDGEQKNERDTQGVSCFS